MLKEFAAKKCVKLGKLLERGGFGVETMRKESGGSDPKSKFDNSSSAKVHISSYNPLVHFFFPLNFCFFRPWCLDYEGQENLYFLAFYVEKALFIII